MISSSIHNESSTSTKNLEMTERQNNAGEHIQKYRRVRFKESSSRTAPSQMVMSVRKHNVSSKGKKLVNEERVLHGVVVSEAYINDAANCYEADVASE
ncbi:hypothetical protein FRX31_011369 [Thalictrum thalictroides]|uniref:Uncharacterized protein n=1 Tax=Thalictrum thalictroides TaxID=46969 RepID=A0A7J6WNT5_THATH|nr:hypothetical protein FRX31_011369 [Thalictrum thalictroides]